MNGFVPLINKVPLTNMPYLPLIEADCYPFHFASKILDHELMNQFVVFFVARCPSPANLNVVVINDHSMKLTWQRPSLVLGPVYYKLVAVTVTSVLTEKVSNH